MVGLALHTNHSDDREVAALGVLGDNAGGVYNRSGIVEAAMRYNASWASYTGYLLSCPTVSFDHSVPISN